MLMTPLYSTKSCIRDDLESINHDLVIFSKWAFLNHLTINEDKTKYMIVSSGTKTENFLGKSLNVVLNGTALERVTKYEYLGVSIEENLTWTSHVNKLIARVQNKIFVFSKISVLLMKT